MSGYRTRNSAVTSSPVGSRAVLRSAVASSSRSSLTVREWSVAIDLMMSAVGSAAVCSPATSRRTSATDCRLNFPPSSPVAA